MTELTLFERFLIFYGVTCPNHPKKWWVHSKLRELIKHPQNFSFEVKRNGLYWLLNPSDFEHQSLFWLGTSDMWDLYHLCAMTSEDCVFYDIGSNYGYYSLILARNKQKKCEIQAFEPNPKTYELLSKHVDMNHMDGVIHTNKLALSNQCGKANLIEREDNSGASRLGDDSQGVSVDITTLDHFFAQSGDSKIDAIKIDVEGHEIKVLEGGRQTIERFKPLIIIEFWSTGLSRAGVGVDDLAHQLESMNYRLYIPQKNRLLPLSKMHTHDIPVNVFAIHRESDYMGTLERAPA